MPRCNLVLRVATLGVLLAAGVSCAANTMYRGIPVATLTDEQLVQELQSAAEGYGVALNRSMYLMAIRPEPAYVLTSSTTNLVASANANYNAYVMPNGYGATVTGSAYGTMNGTATTQYQYTDVNASARLGNEIASAITRSRQRAYRQRAMDVLEEFQRRVAERRIQAEQMIREFFARNPDLQARRPLVAVVAPWAAAEGMTDGRAILERTRQLIAELPRGDGLSGRWYGAFTQTNTGPQGQTFSFSQFVRVDFRQQGSSLNGTGSLGSGERIEVSGRVDQQQISAVVANITSAINTRMTALATSSQITGSFTGSAAGGSMQGTFTLVR
jgi:hypothetical protein